MRESNTTVANLCVGLLGGLRVERAGIAISDVAWQRRGAKRLIKLLATCPSHAIHREQILEILWPNAHVDSARNDLAKALHAARRAVEPERLPRDDSAYLRVRDDMIILDTNHVLIDADNFQRLAQSALRRATVSAYETGLAAYTGVLLPEDLYEDWASERRQYLADLNLQLLLGLAETMEKRGAYRGAVDRLQRALQDDPTREDVHRHLMRLYGAIGARNLALRQFEVCRALLRRELNMVPDRETTALYQDLLADRIRERTTRLEPSANVTEFEGRLTLDGPPITPFVGHEPVLQLLGECLARSEAGNGGLVVVSGEAGVGQTRLVAKFAIDAQRRGVCVLGDRGHASSFPYGQFAVALEDYVAGRPEAERTELALRYPTLGYLVPSAKIATLVSLAADDPDDTRTTYEHIDPGLLVLGTEIARLLTDIAEARPVVVVLGDLDEAHSSSLRLVQYLANLAQQRRWLMIGTLRNEAIVPGNPFSRMLTSMTHEHLCVHVELKRLRRQECNDLVRILLHGRVVPSGFLDRIFSLTLGNPLFVEEVVRDIWDRDGPRAAEVNWRKLSKESFRVPATVRARVERAVVPLGPSVRRVLELVALAGPDVTLDQLRKAAAGLQPPLSTVELFDALDRALSTRMLIERPNAYMIPHTLVREVLLEGLPQHRRAQLSIALGHSAVEILALQESQHPPLTPVS
jgi:DNA-binding SARP family transcriptional activator